MVFLTYSLFYKTLQQEEDSIGMHFWLIYKHTSLSTINQFLWRRKLLFLSESSNSHHYTLLISSFIVITQREAIEDKDVLCDQKKASWNEPSVCRKYKRRKRFPTVKEKEIMHFHSNTFPTFPLYFVWRLTNCIHRIYKVLLGNRQ